MSDPYSRPALRRGAMHYLSAKFTSAALMLLILLSLVRVLSVQQYGVYVTIVAVLELLYVVGGHGLPWLATRYLPEYRLQAPVHLLRRFCRQLLWWHATALIALVALVAVVSGPLLMLAELSELPVSLTLLALFLVSEGLGRFLRDTVMPSLMLQLPARFCLIAKHGLFLLSIWVLWFTGHADLQSVLLAEMAVAALVLTLGIVLLFRGVRSFPSPTSAGWLEPAPAAVRSMARRMFVSRLAALMYSSQILTVVVSRLMGAEAAALFGFLRTFNDQIARYLPANLFMIFIRPKLVAGYIQGGGASQLSRLVNLTGKLSLFVLASLLVVIPVAGDAVVALLSDGTFEHAGLLLFGFLAGLVPFSQRQLLESVAVTLGRSDICLRAAATGLLVIPAFWLFYRLEWGLWAPVLTIALGHLMYNVSVIAGMADTGGYRPDWIGIAKIALSAFVAYGCWLLLPWQHWGTHMPLALAVAAQSLLIVSAYLFVAWLLKPFSSDERGVVNSLVNREVFVW